MAASAAVVHRIPGRVRLRIDERRGDAAYFAQLSERLASLDNVSGAKANPLTASVSLQFAGSLEDVLRHARESGLLEIGDAGNGVGRAPLPAGWPAFASDRKAVSLVSGRDINADFMMGSMWLLIGLVQMLRGRWLPPGLTVLWYARESFRLSNEHLKASSSRGDAGIGKES